MKTQSHHLSALILGLAFGLEKIHKIIPEASPGLNAYFFAFTSKKMDFYLQNLFKFLECISIHDKWIQDCLLRFKNNSSIETILIKDQSDQMFAVQSKILEESSFDYSKIQSIYRASAENVFTSHKISFERMVKAIYQNVPVLNTEYDLGIIFCQKE
jgi:hypothetical protein